MGIEPQSSIGVGIVGLSATRGWAGNAHLPALAAVPGFDLVAASASSADSARAAAERHGVPTACAGAEELARRADVDLVVITVKVPAHLALVSTALAAGKHVLCEWPLGNGLAEAEQLATLADRMGVRGFVGLQARSAPPVRFIRDLVASGEIGEVLSTTLIGTGGRWGDSIAGEVVYLLDRDNGATMLTIPVGHALDGVCSCLGELSEVTATMAVRRPEVTRTDTGRLTRMTAEDQIAVTGRLQSGAVIALHYRGGELPGSGLIWEINGTKGMLLMTGPTGHLQYGLVNIAAAGARDRDMTPLAVPPEYETLDVDPGGLPYAVAHAYARVRDDLRLGTSTAPTFADAVVRHRVLAAIETAAQTGQRQLL